MEEGTSVHKHLSEFNRLKAQVVSAGEKIGDEEQALLLLSSLPKSMKSLVQTILVGKTSLTLNEVSKVLVENDKWLGVENNASNNSVLVT